MTHELVWGKSFERAFKKATKHKPFLHNQIFSTLELLASNPFHPLLDTHKLKGKLEGLWACSVAYDCRIVFELVREKSRNDEVILLVDIGTHEEVY
jgi:addiction module RelE/StbE family toxin